MTGITLPATPEMVATLMILHVRQTGHHWSHATEGVGFICRYCAREMQLPDQPSNLKEGQSLAEAFKTFEGCEQILLFVNGEAAKGFVPNIWHRILGGESVQNPTVVLIQAVDMHHSPLVEWLGTAVPREKERIEIAGKSMSVWHVVWHPISADKRGTDSPEAIVTLVCASL